jgi:hypothetical protein
LQPHDLTPASTSQNGETEIKMTNTLLATRDDLLHGPAVVRALSSMRVAEIALITDVVADVSDRWSVHTHDDYDGYLSILVEPAGSDHACRPSYLVSGTANHIELDQVRGDKLSTMAAFETMPAAAARLVSLLAV